MCDELDTRSYWTDTESIPGYPALDRDLDVDAVVVGAGLTGLTAAYLLQRSGRRVAVLERMRVGGVDSMATTAHVTCVTDTDLADLVKHFGRDHAQAVWDAGFAAIEQIEAIVNAEGIDCDWRRVPGVKHVPLAGGSHDDVKALQEEARLGRELGFDAEFTDDAPFVARLVLPMSGVCVARTMYLQLMVRPQALTLSGSSTTSSHGVCSKTNEPCRLIRSARARRYLRG